MLALPPSDRRGLAEVLGVVALEIVTDPTPVMVGKGKRR